MPIEIPYIKPGQEQELPAPLSATVGPSNSGMTTVGKLTLGVLFGNLITGAIVTILYYVFVH